MRETRQKSERNKMEKEREHEKKIFNNLLISRMIAPNVFNCRTSNNHNTTLLNLKKKKKVLMILLNGRKVLFITQLSLDSLITM